MKNTKGCTSTQIHQLSISKNRRHPSAGTFYTSSAGAVISLILMGVTAFIFSLTGATNLFGLNGSAYADYTISMTSSGAQSINVSPDASGVGTSISVDAVTVTTTCPAGYNLTTTTSVNDNKLYLNGSSSNNASGTYFNPSDGTTALSNAANTWGFYQDGSTVPTASSVFKPVPISTSTPTTIRTSSSTSDSFNIYYGVAVGNDLAPGTYKMIPEQNTNENGTIVYYLTMAEECIETKQYMQDVTKADLAELMPNDGDSATLYDKRDDSDYQVTKINGNYWMTQNLRITGTIPSEGSNFNNVSSWKVDQGDLDSTITPSGYASYTEPRIHSGTDSEGGPTMWYNFCAASANNSGGCSSSVPYEAGTGDVTGDICPYGWRLPTKDEFDGIKNFASDFNIVKGGNYYNGAVNSTTTAYWWSATNAYTETSYGYRQYYLVANASNALSTTQNNTRRGEYIRCIKHEPEPDPCEGHENELYCKVKAQNKGTQTLAELRTEITTSNSGVYEYDSSVFGTASDAANTSTIYYYRGILDNTTGTYGSDGDNAAWPNTVLLDTTGNGRDTSDTCWRIVRTTGSGGVKMIYQGKWTGSTCANAQANAQVTTSAFNGTDSTRQQIVRVGYTHNSTYATNTSQSGTIAQVFGSNSNPAAANNTRSTIKEYIEDTWYANNMTSYTSKLEPSAGYCNDRTMNTSTSWTTPLAETTTIASTYGTSDQQIYYFGAYPRNTKTAQAPSLTCGNKYSQIDRNAVDLYRYVAGSTGVSNQLKYPAALLTADEAAFAGSGYSSSTTPYHTNSFLRSGSRFWLLSPNDRYSDGHAYVFYLNSSGYLGSNGVKVALGVRPAISLKPGSMAVSGSGTAADPWIVDTSASPNPYCTDSSTCMQNTSSGCDKTLTDGRDGATYTTATIAGTCWMTQNLRFTGGELKVGESDVTSDITMAYSQLTSGDSYTEPRIATGSTTDYGTYYNYCAASAGEVCNDTTKQDATRSVCPAGWKLPTQTQINAVPQLDSHFTTVTSLAGYYYGGTLHWEGVIGEGSGSWWSSTSNSSSKQYTITYDSDEDNLYTVSRNKYLGNSIRCVRAS